MKSDPWQAQLRDVVRTALGCGVNPSEITAELVAIAAEIELARPPEPLAVSPAEPES